MDKGHKLKRQTITPSQKYNYSSKMWRLLCSDHLTVHEMTCEEEQKEDIGPASLSRSCSPPSPAACGCRGPSAELLPGFGTADPGSSWNLWRPPSDIFPLAQIQPSVAGSPTGSPREHTPLPRLRLWERNEPFQSRCYVAAWCSLMHIIGLVIEKSLMGKHSGDLTWFPWFHSSNDKNVEADGHKSDHRSKHGNGAELKPFLLSLLLWAGCRPDNESIHTTYAKIKIFPMRAKPSVASLPLYDRSFDMEV